MNYHLAICDTKNIILQTQKIILQVYTNIQSTLDFL